MTDEEKNLFAGLYDALRKTNAALSSTVMEHETMKRHLLELDHDIYLMGERLSLLEAARFRGEHPFLPPAEKMN